MQDHHMWSPEWWWVWWCSWNLTPLLIIQQTRFCAPPLQREYSISLCSILKARWQYYYIHHVPLLSSYESQYTSFTGILPPVWLLHHDCELVQKIWSEDQRVSSTYKRSFIWTRPESYVFLTSFLQHVLFSVIKASRSAVHCSDHQVLSMNDKCECWCEWSLSLYAILLWTWSLHVDRTQALLPCLWPWKAFPEILLRVGGGGWDVRTGGVCRLNTS